MEWQLLLFAMTPVAAYAWLRRRPGSFANAIAGATAVALLEFVVNSIRLARIEWFSLISLFLFVLLGGIALLRKEERYFEMQPVVLDLVLAGIFLHSWYALGIPLLAVILQDHVGLFDMLPAYQRGYASLYATTLSRSLPYLFVVHAGLTAEAALRRSTGWWFLVRVPGFYALLGALFLAERILGVKA